MEEKELGFYIDKANRAYQEQIWMTAFIVTLNSFIISNIINISKHCCPVKIF